MGMHSVGVSLGNGMAIGLHLGSGSEMGIIKYSCMFYTVGAVKYSVPWSAYRFSGALLPDSSDRGRRQGVNVLHSS